MKKGKEWAKEQLEYYTKAVGKPFNDCTQGMINAYKNVENIINQLDELKKPVIPQFVAKHIEESKKIGDRLNVALSKSPETEMTKKMNVTISEANNIYARAWLDGFTIASEDEEMWKPIENYEGLYEVSNKGNVKSLDRDVQYKKTDFTMKIKEVVLKPNVLKKGYLQVALSKSGKPKSMLVHRLVMNAFNPTTDENLQINHINGDKENNEVSNLEWVTAIENTNHAYDIGLRDDTIGNNRKLTEDEVLEIIDLYETGNYTQKELGDKYNVGRNTVGEILLGKTWGWLTGITREVEKEPVYFAKIKGHEFIQRIPIFDEDTGENISDYYRNVYFVLQGNGDLIVDMKDNGLSGAKNVMTLSQWNGLGINETNADFEGV